MWRSGGAGVAGGILFFSSPIGLGHASRDAAIAEAVLDEEVGLGGGAGVRFASGGAAASLLAGHGFDADDAYRPPRFDVRGGALAGAGAWLASYYVYYRRCVRAARRLILRHRPRAVVSDEDFASLSVAQRAGIPTVLVTDVFETRFCRSWPGSLVEARMNGAMRRIVSRCGAVVAPLGPGSGGAGAEGGAEAALAAAWGAACPRAVLAGPAVRRPSAPRAGLRGRLGMDGPTVLVCAGGTGAGRFLLEAAERAAPEFGGAGTIVASGPSLPAAAGAWKGEGGGIRRIGAVPNLHEYVYAADAVVSLAGRSTMDECGQYGTPGVFVPIRGHFEQEDNAAAAGFAHSDVRRLGGLVRGALAGGRRREAEWVAGGGHSPGAVGAARAIAAAAGTAAGGAARGSGGAHNL